MISENVDCEFDFPCFHISLPYQSFIDPVFLDPNEVIGKEGVHELYILYTSAYSHLSNKST